MKAKLLLTLSALFASSMALAGPTCTKEPKEKWIEEAKFQERLKAENYTVNRFKVTNGSCYEIYGKDKAGKKVEIYFNPVDGSIVREERK